jgi:hypothetical protein
MSLPNFLADRRPKIPFAVAVFRFEFGHEFRELISERGLRLRAFGNFVLTFIHGVFNNEGSNSVSVEMGECVLRHIVPTPRRGWV